MRRRSRSCASSDFSELQRHGFGQVADEVGEVVELHALGGGEQLLGLHALDERRADVLVQLDQHFAFELGLDEVPDELALRGRQRFDEQRDLGRMQRIRPCDARAAQRALPERGAQGREPAFLLGVRSARS